MKEQTTTSFNWWLPALGLSGAAITFLPRMTIARDIGFLAMAILAAIIGALLLLVFFTSIRSQTLAALSMLVIFGGAVWFLFRVSDEVLTAGRWLAHSRKYKAEVLSQPTPMQGGLKHAEWDGWGFAGSETVMHVVFDPNDSLAGAARSRSPGKYSGIPCEVP